MNEKISKNLKRYIEMGAKSIDSLADVDIKYRNVVDMVEDELHRVLSEHFMIDTKNWIFTDTLIERLAPAITHQLHIKAYRANKGIVKREE